MQASREIILRTMKPIISFRHALIGLAGFKTVGARALAINDQEEVLLVKHTYMRGWYFPGGGVDRGETPLEAVKRELIEETGYECTERPQLLAAFHNRIHGHDDFPLLFLIKNPTHRHDPLHPHEIAQVAWFPITDPPPDTSPATARSLEEYLNGLEYRERW